MATSLPTLKPLFRKYFKRVNKSPDQSASGGSEDPYPLQFLSPSARGFPGGSTTTDNESEQCMVSNNPALTPETTGTRIDLEEGRVTARSARSGCESIEAV